MEDAGGYILTVFMFPVKIMCLLPKESHASKKYECTMASRHKIPIRKLYTTLPSVLPDNHRILCRRAVAAKPSGMPTILGSEEEILLRSVLPPHKHEGTAVQGHASVSGQHAVQPWGVLWCVLLPFL